MELIKTTKKKINLCTDLEKDYDKECMNIKVKYYNFLKLILVILIQIIN